MPDPDMPDLDLDLALDRVRELRATRPEAIAEAAARRRRRPLLGADGRLMIVAADHPARGALGGRQTPDAMLDRYDLLYRLVTTRGGPRGGGRRGAAPTRGGLPLRGAGGGECGG